MPSSYQDHNGMTLKQKLFCQHYLSNNYNGSEAIRAAYGRDKSDDVCKVMAYENLTKPHIKKYIGAKVKEALEKAGVGLEWRLQMSKQAIEACFNGTATKEGYIHADGVYKGLDQLHKLEGSYATVQTETKVSVEEVDHAKTDELMKQYEKDI